MSDNESPSDVFSGVRVMWPIVDRTGHIVTCSFHRTDPVATFTRTGCKRWPDEVLLSDYFGSSLPVALRHPVTPLP